MNIEIIFQVMIAATCGFFAAGIGRWMMDKRSELRLSSFRAFEVETKAALDRLRVVCGAKVAALMWMHDSGKPMVITSLKRSSVLVESLANEMRSMHHEWQGIHIYGDDFEALVNVQASKSKTTILYADQLRDGVMRMRMDEYQLPGAILSEVFVTDMGYYYIMVEIEKDLHESATNGNMYATKIAQTQINTLCQMAYNQGILE